MKLNNLSVEEAIVLATKTVNQLLIMDHRGGFSLPGDPKASVTIVHKEDDYSEAEIKVDVRFLPEDVIDFPNTSGMGKDIPDAMASLLYGLQLELEERVKAHTEMINKIKEAIDLKDYRDVE